MPTMERNESRGERADLRVARMLRVGIYGGYCGLTSGISGERSESAACRG
jgi:hypothetical protein